MQIRNRGRRLVRAGGCGLLLLPILALTLALPVAPVAVGTPTRTAIVLPGASSAEGIAAGQGSTFYAGDFSRGDIFRGDVRRNSAEVFIDVPDGRQALGKIVDKAHDLLFVAGGSTGQAYVYDTDSGATVATYQLAAPDSSIINDVTLTRDGAWFTDSLEARLYFVPIGERGVPRPARTLTLSGPAADTSGEFNLNGIRATSDDGLLLEAGRLWAVQRFDNQISRVDLSPDLRSGVVGTVVTSDHFQVPTTAARFGRRLAVVNSKFDTGLPPTATRFEVVIIKA